MRAGCWTCLTAIVALGAIAVGLFVILVLFLSVR